MQIISRISEPVAMTFFTLGTHHDFAPVEAGPAAPSLHPAGIGHEVELYIDTSDAWMPATTTESGVSDPGPVLGM